MCVFVCVAVCVCVMGSDVRLVLLLVFVLIKSMFTLCVGLIVCTRA